MIGFRKLRIDPFEGLLLTLLAIVVVMSILFCGTPAFGGDVVPEDRAAPAATAPIRVHVDEGPATVTVNPAVATKQQTLQITPVTRTSHAIQRPEVIPGWIWTSDPLGQEEMEKLAVLYGDYSKHLSPNEAKRIRQILLLLTAGAGHDDADLKTLLYFVTYRSGQPHPLRGILEQRKAIRLIEVDNAKEVDEFVSRMEATAEKYGIE